MKTIEQKAKAYDEALKKIQPLYEQAKKDDNPIWSTYEYFFPELRESEDEKIRKELLEFVSNADTSCVIDEETQARWFNYLQRQKEQKPAWSEEDERILTGIIERGSSQVPFGEPALRGEQMEWLMNILKSLRPQSKDEIYKEKDKAYKLGKHHLAVKFMNYLDENKPKGKMSLSNGECEDIDKAFKENDWAKIMRYVEKYRPSWKPREDEERLINTSISFLKDFADKGYENAVECIDWLKSKLNGNSGK